MFLSKVTLLLHRSQVFLKAHGWSGLIEIIKCVGRKIVVYERLVIYEIDLTKIPSSAPPDPLLKGFELKTISSVEDLDILNKEGYDLSFYPNIRIHADRFVKGAILFCLFVKKELVYRNWLALTRESAFEFWPFLKCIDYDGQVIGDAAETDPNYRRLGIFQFAIAHNIRYAAQLGKSRLLTYVLTNNVASRRAQEKSRLTPIYRGFRIRLFFLWDYYRLHQLTGVIRPEVELVNQLS